MAEQLIKQVRTGKVKQMGFEQAENPMERPWQSAIYKKAHKEQIWLSKTGLQGDEVGDKKVHGGPEKALFAYPEKHYTYWQADLAIAIEAGAMGENLVLAGCDEGHVCIGDIYQAGEVLIQVSQPRRPCWKPARRFKVIDFALRIQQSGRTGWYYRVLQEGYVHAGSHLILVERPYPEWTIANCNEVMYEKKHDLPLAAQLAECTLLAPNWKRSLEKRLQGRESAIGKRVYGPNKE